jgi:hypothetical protein
MTLNVGDDQVQFHGSFEREANSLIAAIGPLSARSTVRHNVKYTGVLRGRAVIGSVYRKSDDPSSVSLLNSSTDGQRALMVISEDEIVVLEPSSPNSRPVVFKRQAK